MGPPPPDTNRAAVTDRHLAAVLVPLFRDRRGSLRLVVVRRTDGGRHGGQLAFPGGRCEPGDESPWATAVREAEEEIGLAHQATRRLADLEPIDTLTTRYRIYPFLASITPPEPWSLQESEIAEVLEPTVESLLRPEAHDVQRVPLPDGRRFGPTACYRIGSHRLWGVSYRILHPLLPRLQAAEWPL